MSYCWRTSMCRNPRRHALCALWLLADRVKSMSHDNKDFESLRRLLALKRYEQPPPGYFNDFATEVMCRLEAGEGAHEGAWQRALWGATWLQRLWAALETRPVMAGTFGATVCALLVGAAIYSEGPQVRPPVLGPAAARVNSEGLATHNPALRQVAFDAFDRLPDQAAIPDNPFPSPPAQGVFPVSSEPNTTLASFSLPGAN
jgi:hypothetical protein